MMQLCPKCETRRLPRFHPGAEAESVACQNGDCRYVFEQRDGKLVAVARFNAAWRIPPRRLPQRRNVA